MQDQGLSQEDVASLIAEHDTNKDGAIDYQVLRWDRMCGRRSGYCSSQAVVEHCSSVKSDILSAA